MRERVLHLISSFWLPLPFLTIRGVDRGEEKAEIWFLIVLHSLENLLIVSISRIAYLQESYPLGIVIFDCVLVLLNLLGVLVSVLYVTKVELYAGLPQDLSSLPSFGPEVSLLNALNPDFPPRLKTQALFHFHFQDVPTGFENVTHGEREIVEEERVSLNQETPEEKQEASIMSTADREVILYVVCCVLDISTK